MSDDEFYDELRELLCKEYTNGFIDPEPFKIILRKTIHSRSSLKDSYGPLNPEERQEHLTGLRLKLLFEE